MLKPVSRIAIVLPKLVGSIVLAAPLLHGAGIIVTLLVGVVTYAAVFTWAGLLSSHALGFALVYVSLWEGLLTWFVSGVRYLSVRATRSASCTGSMKERSAPSAIG